MRRPLYALLAILATACTTAAQSAENLSARVAAAPNGTIAFTYPARANICGDGSTFIVEFVGPMTQNVYSRNGTNFSNFTNFGDSSYRERCTPGPVRIVLNKRGGEVVDMFAFVGQTGRPVNTDLGAVTPQEAADYLLNLARKLPEIAGDAFMAAQLGEGSRISVALLAHARDQRVSATVRESAVKWVGRTASREETMDQVLPALREIATSAQEETSVRERAVRSIGEMPRGEIELRAIYGRLDLASLRERAIRVFAEVGGNTNTNFIRDVALNANEDGQVRERAVRVLGEELGRLDIVRDLYPRLDRSELRVRAVRVAAEHLTSESAQWVRNIAENDNEDHDIRDRAIRTLGEAGFIGQLRTMYAKLHDGDLKSRIIRIAGEHGSGADITWIEQIAADEREADDLRDRAVRVLSEHGTATSRLVTLYDKVESYPLQERLLKIMGERADRESIDHLIKVARNGTGDLRRRAVKLLAESNDPRALEFLKTTVTR